MSRRRTGFTLIELLVVILVIGILAAIAVPRYGAAREKSKTSVLTTDLRNLTTAQEAWFFEHREYTSDFDSLRFRPTARVVVTIGEATNTGWSATAEQPTLTRAKCAIFYGNAAPVDPATLEGSPACR